MLLCSGAVLMACALILVGLATSGVESVGPRLTTTPEQIAGEPHHIVRRPLPLAGSDTTAVAAIQSASSAENSPQRRQRQQRKDPPPPPPRQQQQSTPPARVRQQPAASPPPPPRQQPAASPPPQPRPYAAAYLAHLRYMTEHPGTGPEATEAHRSTWLTEARGVGAAGRASRDLELTKMMSSAGWRAQLAEGGAKPLCDDVAPTPSWLNVAPNLCDAQLVESGANPLREGGAPSPTPAHLQAWGAHAQS